MMTVSLSPCLLVSELGPALVHLAGGVHARSGGICPAGGDYDFRSGGDQAAGGGHPPRLKEGVGGGMGEGNDHTATGSRRRVTFYGPGDDILDLIPEAGVTDLRELGLNERQIEALRLMVNEGQEMTNREYREMFDVGNQTAARELEGLVEKGQAGRIGRGRVTQYEAI